MQFSAAIFATAALVAGVAADFSTVQSDVQKIQTDVASLYSSLKNTDGTSYVAALAINSASQTLNSQIQTANSDAAAVGSVTDAQAQSLINSLQATYANVSAASQRLIALEPAFQKLGIAGIAQSDIKAIQASTQTFGATLVAKAPTALKASASTLASEYNAALASAAAAYASA
ncbi:hypothetical protein OC835_005778 [Tilletia horrida]|nr:hypothetical protein OC835_005778 [Tilletia horrida]